MRERGEKGSRVGLCGGSDRCGTEGKGAGLKQPRFENHFFEKKTMS